METIPVPELQGHTVLIVDDVPINLGVVVEYLEAHGLEVLIAQNGEECLTRVQFVKPDIILLDVMMPKLDGFETCRQLKANESTRDIPVIFMTALADVGNRIIGFEAGGVDYVTKPFYTEEVLARLKVHLQLRRMQLQLAAQNDQLRQEITFRQQAERQVVERTAQLIDANRELESFSYSVSHDLRAPLRAIDGFSQILFTEYTEKLDEIGKGYLRRVCAGSQHMSQLIDAMLKLSQLAHSEMFCQRVNLSELVNTIVTELRQVQPERQVEIIIAPEVLVNADLSFMRIALENLLGNAWKFTRKNAQSKIEFGVSQDSGETAYFVRDDGAGFDTTYAEKLFAPFQRFHRATEFEGTGIGLATVRRVISRHGGRVWAESAVNNGTTIYFTLAVPTTSGQSH
ncbi:MAG: response regulator [Pseudomonadota bacterium]